MSSDAPEYKFRGQDYVKLTRRDISNVPYGTIGKILGCSARKINGDLTYTNYAYYVRFDNGQTLSDVPEGDLEKVERR
ncbi:hypothetical protein AGABI1DRAFT_121897 [Agaricus bisporus var. burnettii JB137-S8]|uniref:Uncharacterized protein n=1 Tax=Agaricus bisporus var. burnettii (strain JB137-S8 / ATCC MYA-4627 / FGSC 10392) TaxID=597362 RepID=K5XSD5_AGABU|nr:hypothetical protein AGABI2DRAFT_194075 [Agaricus bisporus var. bisporus H97]XP_007331679.1 uncharacterized protein AGABI1DRAFT_121897 [Agaricus bisporus var. burnettii JB137-S8]EKM77855.1 hypothetical protein AGABI1DRAFT_121897 [Agaricus bisporus var. burnettii JB137-S8]EKV44961.1 hypothetical protein AGABI2DRAFT_194075 [Agaricus bisporus var. bisporus H97]